MNCCIDRFYITDTNSHPAYPEKVSDLSSHLVRMDE